MESAPFILGPTRSEADMLDEPSRRNRLTTGRLASILPRLPRDLLAIDSGSWHMTRRRVNVVAELIQVCGCYHSAGTSVRSRQAIVGRTRPAHCCDGLGVAARQRIDTEFPMPLRPFTIGWPSRLPRGWRPGRDLICHTGAVQRRPGVGMAG